MSQGSSHNRVRVEDALSYLDLVKTQFADQPNVYTHFLDIMKDFKSQTIDTPGVIARVSQLFGGRPNLIVGFNTFLPAGFQVNIDNATGKITISEPSGTIRAIETHMDSAESGNEQEGRMNEGVEEQAAIEADEGWMEEEAEEENTEREETPWKGEFSRAVAYVNQIKTRFATRPIVYKEFLEILNTYQRANALNPGSLACERNVMDAISRLFDGDSDLLEQFQLFLPSAALLHKEDAERLSNEREEDMEGEEEGDEGEEEEGEGGEGDSEDDEEDDEDEEEYEDDEDDSPLVCRRQMSLNTALNSMKYEDLALFEKMAKVIGRDAMKNVLRHLDLYSSSISSRTDLLRSLSFILRKHPQLQNSVASLVRYSKNDVKGRPETQENMEIDYSSCRLLGVSYRSLPLSYPRPVCSGRTPLCNEVLNDTWVSFPSWSSEDSSSVSSKKTQYEEFVYRTEDERFELDIVIEMNRYALQCMEHLKHVLSKMSPAEQERYRLPADNFGVSSPSILLRAIRRIYGEHANKIIESLRRNPATTVPILFARLSEKEDEWREAQRGMNKIWREQSEKHNIRSLDHHSTLVKNHDSKQLRTKNLISQIENMQEECSKRPPESNSGPHMTLEYPEDRRALRDATQLIIHHVRRSNMSKEEKRRVKKVLRRFIPELFALADEEMSDQEDNSPKKPVDDVEGRKKRRARSGLGEGFEDEDEKFVRVTHLSDRPSNTYRLIYGGNVFYSFIRMHQLLCDRLGKLRKLCHELYTEQKLDEKMRAGSSTWMDAQKGLQKLKGPLPPTPSFDRVMHLVKESLDGILEPVALEDELRSMLSSDGHLAFTLDKMVLGVTRQLHIFSSCDTDKAQTLNLYSKYRLAVPPSINGSTPTRTTIEKEYEAEAKNVMEGHNCYRIYIIDAEIPLVTIDLLEVEDEEEDDEEEEELKNKEDEGKGEKGERNDKEKNGKKSQKKEKKKNSEEDEKDKESEGNEGMNKE